MRPPPPTMVMVPHKPDAIPLDIWIGLAIGIAALLAAAAYAHWRAARPQARAPRRFRRILASAAMFAATIALTYLPFALLRDEAAGDLAFEMAAILVTFLIGATIIFALADLIVGLLGPRRTRRWLAGAPVLFLATTTAAVAVPAWLIVAQPELNLRQLMIVAASVAASLVWWSFLPVPEEHVAEVFD